MFRTILVLLFLSALVESATAQYLDPYRRINDPLAIADLNGPDSSPIIRSFLNADAPPIEKDGYSVWAADTGYGILRHLWIVYKEGLLPIASKLKLWVDDSLVFNGIARDLFTFTHGLLRAPFDSSSAGAQVCEVQIPYHRNFRWSQLGAWALHDAEWQHIDTTQTRVHSISDGSLSKQQVTAENNYLARRENIGTKINFVGDISSADTIDLAHLKGPAYIKSLLFQFSRLDTFVLQHQHLLIYWDDCPVPSIDLPVSDLFGVSTATPDIHAFFFSVDSTRCILECSFPMPFKVSARLRLINELPFATHIDCSITYQDTAWYGGWGYFAVQHHVSPEIAYHILHPVLHTKGVGRYVGAIFSIANSRYSSPVFMEGDGYLMVDSSPYSRSGYSTHYIGTEDYCDGGWYFLDTSSVLPPRNPPLAFSLPFRGCPSWPTTMYRLHVNAPYIYSRSMDIDFGHGFFDDYTATYRTTAFYYKRWIPFYPSSDTVRYGNIWKIAGSGYSPNEKITIRLDTTPIYAGLATINGTFDLPLTVSTDWPSGDHMLSINGIMKSEPITVRGSPKILYLQDSANRVFSERDSIELRGYGFQSNEQLSLRLGDTLFTGPSYVVTDADGAFRVKAFLPWIPEGGYHVAVSRTNGALVVADSPLYITRTLNYEFELLHNPDKGAEYSIVYNGLHMSQGGIAFCYGNAIPGREFSFEFSVPYADTFAVTVFGLKGSRYGSYRTYIDSLLVDTHDWHYDGLARESKQIEGAWLSQGIHTMRFVNEDPFDRNIEFSLALDHLHLRPLSENSRASVPGVPSGGGSIKLFPNPLDQSVLSISGIADSVPGVSYTLFDEIGRQTLQGHFQKQADFWTTNISAIINGHYWLVLHLPDRTLTIPLLISRQD
jgi:hypothetical protein